MGGLYHSKMVNSGPRSYCNTFWVISGTSTKLSKSRPGDLLSITKTAQRYKTNYGIILERILFISIWDSKIDFVREMYVLGTICFDVFSFCVRFRFLWKLVTYVEKNFVEMRIDKWLFSSNKMYKSLDMNFISITKKKHEMEMWLLFYFQVRESLNIWVQGRVPKLFYFQER